MSLQEFNLALNKAIQVAVNYRTVAPDVIAIIQIRHLHPNGRILVSRQWYMYHEQVRSDVYSQVKPKENGWMRIPPSLNEAFGNWRIFGDMLALAFEHEKLSGEFPYIFTT